MKINTIVIYGFAHCGTTILKEIVGNIPSVHKEPSGESLQPSEHLLASALKEDKRHVLIKHTHYTARNRPEPFLPDLKGEHKTIFITRNPYYVFSSLNRRFPYGIPNDHSFALYERVANKFLETKINKTKNLYHIKYEDMFTNDYENLKRILDNLELKYSSNIFDKRAENQYQSAPLPSGTHHQKFRDWQVSQPFLNMNSPSKLNLTFEQKRIISQSDIVTKLGYNYE